MAPPSTLPTWDSNGANLSTPNSFNLANGWTDQQAPPYQWMNWWMYWVSQWMGHISSTAYTNLQTALNALSVGDSAAVDEYDGDKLPGSVDATAAVESVGSGIASVDTDGEITVYLEITTGVARAVNSRWATGTFDTTDRLVTYTLTSYTSVSRVIRTNGQYTVVAYDNHAEIFNAVTGASIADIDHGAAVYDICLDGVQMYLVGASGTGTKTVRCITLATGASVWTYNHGATTYACCTDGRRLFIAGAASGHASTSTCRALEAATGNDAANEGGTAQSTWEDIWDQVNANLVNRGQVMVTDGARLWVAYAIAASNTIEQIGTAAGNVQASFDLKVADYSSCLAIDHTRLFYGSDDSSRVIICFEKDSFPNICWTDKASASDSFVSICTDGFAITVGSYGNGSGGDIHRRYRRNCPTRIRKVTPADQYNPYRLAFIAAGE